MVQRASHPGNGPREAIARRLVRRLAEIPKVIKVRMEVIGICVVVKKRNHFDESVEKTREVVQQFK